VDWPDQAHKRRKIENQGKERKSLGRGRWLDLDYWYRAAWNISIKNRADLSRFDHRVCQGGGSKDLFRSNIRPLDYLERCESMHWLE
jgi:hypothetical protein